MTRSESAKPSKPADKDAKETRVSDEKEHALTGDSALDTEEILAEDELVTSDEDELEDLAEDEELLDSSSDLMSESDALLIKDNPVATRRRTSRGTRPRSLDDVSSGREDPVKTYLREIGKVPLLTKEEEVQLAMAMEAGIYAELTRAHRSGEQASVSLSDMGESDPDDPEGSERRFLEDLVEKGQQAEELLQSFPLDGQEIIPLPAHVSEEDLTTLIQRGRAARERLTVSNLRLVVSIAKRYMNRGLSFLDLIQEGNMGLMKAVEKFDYTRGYKFSTYATWWIRQAITRAIADQSRTIRVPVHMIETVRELNRVKREYIQSHGNAPTLEDLSELTGMSIDKIKKVENVSQYTASLERPIGDEDEDTLGDFIEDPSAPSPTKETFRMFLKEQLNRALEQLDEREREILRLRYGLDDDHPRTLKDVSLKFNITRERVRQIEIKAIEKLKHPSRRAELKKFRELLLGEE